MSKDMKFEDAIAMLEEAVRLLESGELSLDESIEKYEESIKYVKICTEKLEKAEQKVKVLIQGADGSITDAPFIADET